VPLHGLSRPYKDFSYKHAAEDLKSILDTEHIDRVLLVGMSMGGYPSQMFGDLFPDRVDGFVALDTSPFGLDYYSASDLRWLKRVPGMAKMFPDQFLRKSMAKSVSQTSYSYNRMMSMLRPSSKQEIIEQLAVAYEQFPHENKDVHFTFPVLILLGDDDTTGKVSEYCRAWSNATGYPVHMIKNARHFSNGDNPEQVNAEIQKFADAVYAH
ncbi:MAG: alpha/beta hydrolase, partial [Eggerthellaceae bacterium]|nr:alpha/beta hydrolase [Eggerthellaceae bacterium]